MAPSNNAPIPHPDLRPGDILLFDRQGIFNFIVKLKRGEKYSHVEIYIGDGKVFASRNGKGVNLYPVDYSGLKAIYRVTESFDLAAGIRWFFSKELNLKGEIVDAIRGQGYDWFGLLSFTWAKFQGRENRKMFCSEFVVRFFRMCGVWLFSKITDADAVSPGMIPYSPRVTPLVIFPTPL